MLHGCQRAELARLASHALLLVGEAGDKLGDAAQPAKHAWCRPLIHATDGTVTAADR